MKGAWVKSAVRKRTSSATRAIAADRTAIRTLGSEAANRVRGGMTRAHSAGWRRGQARAAACAATLASDLSRVLDPRMPHDDTTATILRATRMALDAAL